jgi:hypothetical protein
VKDFRPQPDSLSRLDVELMTRRADWSSLPERSQPHFWCFLRTAHSSSHQLPAKSPADWLANAGNLASLRSHHHRGGPAAPGTVVYGASGDSRR